MMLWFVLALMTVAAIFAVMWPLERRGPLRAGSDVAVYRDQLDEIEREIRAQINRALALGIRPTHLDSHMGSLFTTPALIATYVKVRMTDHCE